MGQVICVCLAVIEFRGSDVQTNINATLVARVLDCLSNDFKSVVFISKLRRSETTLVTNVGSGLTKLFLKERSE